jgi:hypothetical protein
VSSRSSDSRPVVDPAVSATALFLRRFQERERVQTRRQDTNQRLVEEKNKALIPIRKLLKLLIDAGVQVTHESACRSKATGRSYPPQPLQVFENESSAHWRPGSSIFLEHPAVLEIAVTNLPHRAAEGLVRIACSSPHPDAHLLTGPFTTSNAAVQALAEFLARSTVRVDRPSVLQPASPVEEVDGTGDGRFPPDSGTS